MPAGRIEMYLLSDEMKNLINAGMKIFPVTYSFVQANQNPNNYEYVKVTDTTDHKREIYTWDNGWALIGADDYKVSWNDIPDKPGTYPPSTHNHDTLYSPLNHNHDTTYSKLGHQHTEADITDLNKYSKLETDNLLSQKAALDHNHDGRYAVKATESTVSNHETRITTIENASGHSHANLDTLDKLVYTGAKTSIDLVDIENNTSALGQKANSSDLSTHTGNTTVHITSAERTTWNAKSNFSGSYTDLTNKPTIPANTSQLTNDSGFITSVPNASTTVKGIVQLSDSTSTTSSALASTSTAVKSAYDLANGKYTKPGTGIPKTDLDSSVQTSLGKADSAIQSIPTASTTVSGIVQLNNNTNSTLTTQAATANAVKVAYDLANGKYSKPAGGIPKTDLDSTVQTSLGKADTALQVAPDEISIGATQPTTSLWYKVVG